MELITSRTNALVKAAAALKKTDERNKKGLFLLEGARLCADAAENGIKPERFFFTARAAEKHPEAFRLLVGAAQNVFYISDSVAEKLSDTKNPQGFFCVCRKITAETEIKASGIYIFTDDVQNPDNLGAVVRTAEALGADGIIVNSGCDVYSPKALRAAMGALLRFPVIKTQDGAALLESCVSRGMRVFAGTADSDRSIMTADKSGGIILVIGNEGSGISADILSLATDTVTIPMKGKAESLNAAEAATILMWEFIKDR